MPSLSRRRLLGGGAALAAGAYGGSRLYRGATDADFASWTPDPGTWPLARYDPANTAHNSHASPPRERPTSREIATLPTADSPRRLPLVGPDGPAVYGSGLALLPRGSGDPVRVGDAPAQHAGFGPDGRLHAVRLVSGDLDARSALVGYAGEDPRDLREAYRFPVDTDYVSSLTVGAGERYVGTPDREVRAFDPGSGRGWRVGGTKTALADGRLYATEASGRGTVAYEERSGVDRRLDVGPRRVWSAGWITGEAHPPAVADGRVALGSRGIDGGALVAYDAESGERLWEPRPLGMDVATPALVGDRGYVAAGTDGLESGLVAAIDLATGESIWRDEVEWYAFAPAVGGDTLVVAGERRTENEPTDGVVRAYDRHSGDVLWTVTVEAWDPDGLALAGDRVLVAGDASLYELR